MWVAAAAGCGLPAGVRTFAPGHVSPSYGFRERVFVAAMALAVASAEGASCCLARRSSPVQYAIDGFSKVDKQRWYVTSVKIAYIWRWLAT